MRFAILGISHETNTFSRVPTDYAAFEAADILRGHELVDRFKDSTYTIAGYLQAAEELGFEAVPLMWAQTGPLSTITRDAYDRLTEEMFGMLREQGPWDGVLIANHGAAVAEHHPDMDAAFAEGVRAIVGPAVPIGGTLDMHGNVSKRLVDVADITMVWRTNPHLDPKSRSRKCAELVFRTAKREIRPVQWIETPPLVVNIVQQFTGQEPMKSLVADCVAANERPGILDTSIAEGYPYSDVEQMGMAWIAIADGDLDAAKDAAGWMASRAWEQREALNAPIASIGEALDLAVARYRGPRPLGDADPVPADGTPLAAAASSQTTDGLAPRLGPIVLMDVGDNIGGGSSADSTAILEEAQRRGITSLLQTLYDPEAVAACVAAGVGAEVSLEVGAKTDDLHGRPVAVTGTVRTIVDGHWEDPGVTHGGFRFFHGGTMVRLDTTDGHTLVLTSLRVGNTSRYQMYSTGIHPETYRIVVAKGVVSPRPAYQPIAGEVILVNTPGVASADLSTFTYHRRRTPLYPFERDATYTPGD
jgi:microcystin degradation protein MlrC